MTEYTSLNDEKLPESTYAVLGLIEKEPGSGYDLANFADRALSYFWPVSRTLVYRELGRLEQLGWVAATDVTQKRYPDKRVWSLTAAGAAALAEWTTRPASGGSFRSGFLLKLMFGASMPAENRAALLADYRESQQATARDLSSIVEALEGRDEATATMGRITALYGLRTAEATLAWVDEAERELARLLPYGRQSATTS